MISARDLGAAIEKTDRFLKSDPKVTLIVDVQNHEDYQDLRQHYKVGSNVFISAKEYCPADSDPQFGELYSDLAQKEGVLFVTGLGVFLKLLGEEKLRRELGILISLSDQSIIKGHVVVITYQLKRYLEDIIREDSRLERRIIAVEGREGSCPSLIFTSEKFKTENDRTTLDGISSLADIEGHEVDSVRVFTQKTGRSYPRSLINIEDRNSAYDMLCDIDSTTAHLEKTFGTEEQWLYAWKQFAGLNSWEEVFSRHFGRIQPSLAMYQYPRLSDEEKWLFFIGLKLFGCADNEYLNTAVKDAADAEDFVRMIYRCIVSEDPHGNDFEELYTRRKEILKGLGNPRGELTSFCNFIRSKGKEAICYLTDNTKEEKELVFELLDRYGEDYGRPTVNEILKRVYPDLAAYLAPYEFPDNKFLTDYFGQYKYQKVINRVFPEFEKIVTEQAQKREYNLFLQPRASIMEGVEKENARLYFVDAMGVEYLSFILAQCSSLKLRAKITVCRCELPSITDFNKEFLEYFQGKDQVVSIKDIDNIKHSGENDYNYQKTKLPIHLAKELDILKDLLEKIKTELSSSSGKINKVIMIADHGASRLAVIHETETVWEMPEKGKSSGRYCRKSDIDTQPAFATDAGEFWVLASYDRFKGSRRASVEAHGGATLEEITVPVIELTYNPAEIEVYILPASGTPAAIPDVPEVEVSYKKNAAVKICISAKVSDVSIRIDGKSYPAREAENQPNCFDVEMKDIKRPQIYTVDVYAGDNRIAAGLKIRVKHPGMSTNSSNSKNSKSIL